MALSSSQIKIVADNLQVLQSERVPWAVAKLMMAQAMHETSRFQSRLFILEHNAFGIKFPKVRKSPYAKKALIVRPPSGEGATPYCAYNNVADSFKDRVHKAKFDQMNYFSVATIPSYLAHLVKIGYFGYSPSATAVNIYKSGLTNNLNLLSDFIEPVVVTTGGKKNEDVLGPNICAHCGRSL